jgi:hypothetical protein
VARLALVVLAAAAAAVAAAAALARSSDTDRNLCPFPVEVQLIRNTPSRAETAVLAFTLEGPVRILLRNQSTKRTVVLDSTGSYSIDGRSGSVRFHGHNVWYWGLGDMPFLVTDGAGTFVGPRYRLSPGRSHARVLDPCVLLAPTPPKLTARTTPAPWPLPTYPLSRIRAAHLTPLLGRIVRHDHVHLDVVVDGRKVTVPAGVGLAEPMDNGPCKPVTPAVPECYAGDYFTAFVANSPLHTHTASGMIHIEADRKGRYTLGQFFDEWGVRFSQTCLGTYCADGGKELAVFVDGHRVNASLRSVLLGNQQEIAVAFGSPSELRSVPSAYGKPWPGPGCGGAGEISC